MRFCILERNDIPFANPTEVAVVDPKPGRLGLFHEQDCARPDAGDGLVPDHEPGCPSRHDPTTEGCGEWPWLVARDGRKSDCHQKDKDDPRQK